MTPEQENKIDGILQKTEIVSERVERLEIFLVGDTGLGTSGLKQKVDYHDKKISEFQADKIKVITGATIGSILMGYLSAWFSKNF